MAEEHPEARRARLRDCWNHWTAIIALFAGGRPARRRVDPRAYAALRDELMATCRSLAEADAERHSYYAALEEVVRPWLSPRVLGRTDREILGTLLRRCREVERELGGRKGRWEWPEGIGTGPIAIAGGAAALGLVLAWLMGFGRPAFEAIRDVADTAWLTIVYASDFQKLAAVAALIVAVAIYTIVSSVRSRT